MYFAHSKIAGNDHSEGSNFIEISEILSEEAKKGKTHFHTKCFKITFSLFNFLLLAKFSHLRPARGD